jgi:hypothetical protein
VTVSRSENYFEAAVPDEATDVRAGLLSSHHYVDRYPLDNTDDHYRR